MQDWICETCGVQHPESDRPPEHCAICEDARQYVPRDGQSWTTLADLRKRHRAEFRDESGVLGIGCEPSFAIGQRALLVRTEQGNVLWDCVPLLDGMAERVEAEGGLAAIAIDHPHFHSTMVEWSRAFDAPVYVHAADRRWVMRPDPAIVLWEGESREILPGVTLVRCGGHFEGSTVLHWAERHALLSGDIITVVADEGWVSFMYSYPNLIPLDAATVRTIAARVEPLDFDRLYGGWWGRVIETGAKDAVRRSAARYVAAIEARSPQ